MVSVLAEIVARKEREVRNQKSCVPEGVLQELAERRSTVTHPPRGFVQRLLEESHAPKVIAELKRASPSKGVLRPTASWKPEKLARAYEDGGAACVSVLTDVESFWGCPSYIAQVRSAIALPIIRKDFIIETYQVYESRLLGADAILLMASVLPKEKLRELAGLAMALSLDVLLESDTDTALDVCVELAASLPQSRVAVGINNRNLRTLEIDLEHGRGLLGRARQKLGDAKVALVSESGVTRRAHLEEMTSAGADAFLVGTHLAASAEPKAALTELLTEGPESALRK